MSKPVFTIGVFAVIIDEKRRVLLCRRTDHDLWNLPGGGLENGEAPWEGVVREVKEETGLDVEVKYLSGVYAKSQENDLVFQFVCEVVGGEIIISDEADEIGFFAFNDIPINTAPKQITRVKDALDNSEKTVMRRQAGRPSLKLIEEGFFDLKKISMEKLNQLRKLLVENKKLVSEMEYTSGNYDNDGNVIEENLPTITTDFCEIGSCGKDIYFVFVLESKDFSLELFEKIKDRPGLRIYGFDDFCTDLYLMNDFDFFGFLEKIGKEKYVQIQFSYEKQTSLELLKEYLALIDIFKASKTKVINQLKIDLRKK